MTWEQGALLAVLAGTLAIFVWDRWRFDIVAVAALMICVLTGIIRPDAAFAGFSSPAVVTVAMVLVITQTLARSGLVDDAARRCTEWRKRPPHRSGPSAPSRPAVGLHEQCRCAGADDAAGALHRPAERLSARSDPDAAVLRHDAGRHVYADRHAAQPADLGLSRTGDGPAFPDVRFSARWGWRSPSLDWRIWRWPAGGCCRVTGRSARRYRAFPGQRLCDRGADPARLALGWAEGRAAGG